MKSLKGATNNGGDEAPVGHSLSPSERSNARDGLHLIGLLVIGTPWKSPNNSGYCQSQQLSPQTEKSLLLKTTLIYLHGPEKLSCKSSSASFELRDLSAWYAGAWVAQTLCTHLPLSGWTVLREKGPRLGTAQVAKNLRRERPLT